MWVVKIFFASAFHEGHSGLRVMRKLKKEYQLQPEPKAVNTSYAYRGVNVIFFFF